MRSRWDALAVRLTGRSAYRPAWALQRELWARRRRLALPDTLLLLEHAPVITLGRFGDERFLRLPDDATGGPEVVRIDRGGEITYHGPGQLTAYLIADLRAHGLGAKAYVHGLEEAVLGVLADLGVEAGRREGLIGVWARPGGSPAKVAAAGVRIAGGVAMHGIALNVENCALQGFGWMVPCGLAGAQVTSIEALTGAPITVGEVAPRLADHLARVFELGVRPLELPGPATEADVAPLLERIERHGERGGRRPAWLRIELPRGSAFAGVRRTLRAGSLCTVCEEARCPNRQECWNSGTATFLILGGVCSRACRFCAVEHGRPGPADPDEPVRLARAVVELGLNHVVITSVTRDDLPDGGAGAFAAAIRAVRAARPQATLEVLIPDFGGDRAALEVVLDERPEVLNHNVETVPRLYPHARPGAEYARSLEILRHAAGAGLAAKSGFMLGLGESPGEVRALLHELRGAGCSRVTIGQYLQPRRACLTVKRYWSPDEFDAWAATARALGFAHVESGPLVRSSYHAGAAPLERSPLARRAAID